jgi:hypothetical protein
MAEAVTVETETKKKQPVVPKLIKNPKAALQAFETGAKDRLGHLVESSNARLTDLDHLLDCVSKEDWSFSGMRRRVEALRGRAESARAAALKRVDKMPSLAVTAVASAGRARVQDLARGLKWVEKRLEQNGAKPLEPAAESTPRAPKKAS